MLCGKFKAAQRTKARFSTNLLLRIQSASSLTGSVANEADGFHPINGLSPRPVQ